MKFQAAFYLFRKEMKSSWSERILLSMAVGLGLSALLMLDLYSRRIESTIQGDTKALLAGDFQIQSFSPFDPSVRSALKEIVGEGNYNESRDLLTTAFLPNGETQTISLRAVEPSFPYYGNFSSAPTLSAKELHTSQGILVDQSFKNRGVQVGDILKIANHEYKILGFITEEPQSVATFLALGARVYMSLNNLEASGLSQFGSRVFRSFMIKSSLNTDTFREQFRKKISDTNLRIISPERANNQSRAVIERIRSYLSLVALAALILGSTGVLMMFRSYFMRRMDEFLALRCLGLSRQSFYAFVCLEALLTLIMGLGVASVLGVGIEALVASSSEKLLGMSTQAPRLWPSLLKTIGIGMLALWASFQAPLSAFLKISPAETFREGATPKLSFGIKEGLHIFIVLFCLSWGLSGRIVLSIEFISALALASLFILLSTWPLEKFFLWLSKQGPYWLKLASIKAIRERSSTSLLMMTLGLSFYLVLTLQLFSSKLKGEVAISKKLGIPNLVFLGLSETDLNLFTKLVPTAQLNPVIQARLLQLDGRVIEELRDDEVERKRFLETREYTLTRRLDLAEGEKLVSGTSLFGAPEAGIARVSLEKEFSVRMKLKVGSKLKLSIAGVELDARVDSLRSVDWFNFRPNFFIVVNLDDLKEAPMDYVGIASVNDNEVQALQSLITKELPKISPIDARQVAKKIEQTLSRLSSAVMGVAFFSLLSSFFVLVGFLLSKREAQKREAELFRCLGIPSGPRRNIYFIELGFVGLAALCSASIAAVLSLLILS